MKLTLGYSPCPNDTFIFDAMVHGKIDTEGLDFVPVLADVEILNQRAFRSELDISKVSYHAYINLVTDYILLNSGSALGRSCGPLLISKQPVDVLTLADDRIGIPGQWTTANFLLQFYLKKRITARIFVFSEIEHALLDEIISAGVIIHENRFTYAAKGLKKIQDLGEYWDAKTHVPIPLGGIAARRSLEHALLSKVDRVMRRSVDYALANPLSSHSYVRAHAQEMDDAIVQQHIQLYVNEFTRNLGQEGRKAVQTMLDMAFRFHSIAPPSNPRFVEP